LGLVRALVAGLLCIAAGAVQAADFVGYSKFCVSHEQSDVLLLNEAELEVLLVEHRETARMARETDVVIYSRKQTFNWALATELQCNVALGYIKGGNIDDVSTQKCDCFYDRMMSFR
jgi:hypothetical protein